MSAAPPIERDTKQIGTFETEVRHFATTNPLIRHAGLIVTIGYAFLTIVGLVYSWLFYKNFGINVLEFSEASDFVAAAIREPVAVILCITPALLTWLVVQVRRTVRKLSPRFDAYATHHETNYGTRYRAVFWVLGPLLILTYAFSFSLFYAQASAARVRAGKGRLVRVVRTAPVASDSARKIIVGTTSKFFFFYDTLSKTTDIVPVGNVAAITVDAPRKRAKP